MRTDVTRDTHVGDLAAWGLPAWDFDEFHRHELPRRLDAGANEEVAWALDGVPPFALRLADGRAYTYLFDGQRVRIEPGILDAATGVVEIGERAWQNYVHELRNLSSLVLAGDVQFHRGSYTDWVQWHPILRRLYSGAPVYDENAPLLDRAGEPLDLHRSFSLDTDDHEEISHFLRTAGYVKLRGAMAHRRDEIAEELERRRAAAREGEIFSWWVDNKQTGDRFPYRLMYLSEQSELIRSLMDDDPTVAAMVRLAKRDLIPLHDRGQGAMSVLKPFGANTELGPALAANLGWHRDCDLGGCPIMCPSINIGIHLDAAGPHGSQLWALAGSNGRTTTNTEDIRLDHPRAIPLDTQSGDVSIHYSCTLHAGPPPVGPDQRRTLYLPFYGPDTLELLGHRFASFEQVLPNFGSGDIPSFYDSVEEARSTDHD